MSGAIQIVGLGPGGLNWLAPGARQAIEEADVLLGYQRYLRQIQDLAPETPREGSGMRHEVERARRAIALACEGKRVALVSGGDAGIYGMAGLVLELIAQQPENDITAEVLPGISALNAAAALLGAPLMTDFAAISLSDYLTPLETIMNRVRAAIQGDFVICLYNPRSHQRTLPFDQTYQLLLDGFGGDRPVGLVRAAFREDQQVICTTLSQLPNLPVEMDCVLIVGNSATRMLDGRMVTPRGYPIGEAAEGSN